jgi:general stress protein 26
LTWVSRRRARQPGDPRFLHPAIAHIIARPPLSIGQPLGKGVSMNVDWETIAPDFQAITSRIVWCTVTTVDRKGRPRGRILHPVWDGQTGWIATGRNTFKAKHIAANPYVSCSYWDQQHQQAYAETPPTTADHHPTNDRDWDLICNAPPPVGYDLNMFWPCGKTDPNFGALKLEPWRIEVWSLQEMMQGKQARVWKP